jgi:hypothetical protein
LDPQAETIKSKKKKYRKTTGLIFVRDSRIALTSNLGLIAMGHMMAMYSSSLAVLTNKKNKD